MDFHTAEMARLAPNPKKLQDDFGVSGELPYRHTRGSNPQRYWGPSFFYPTVNCTLCLLVFAEIGEGKDLNHLGAWADYLPGAAWEELVCWVEKGGSLPQTELRMLGRVVSEYMNWMDSFGVLPRWTGAQSLQISEWNLWHLKVKNARVTLKLGQEVMITAIGSHNNAGRKATKGAAVAAYAKLLEVVDRVTEPAGPAAVAQFRSHWNSASAYVQKDVIQEGAEFQRLLKHGRTDQWLLEQKEWASASPQMMIDASEALLRAKEELAVKEAQLVEEKATLQLVRGHLELLQKEKEALLLQLQKEKEEALDNRPQSSEGDLQKIKDAKVSVMEQQLSEREREVAQLTERVDSKAENLETAEKTQADRHDALSKVVANLQQQMDEQRTHFQERLLLQGDEAADLEKALKEAKGKLEDSAATLEDLKHQREEALTRANKADEVVALVVASMALSQVGVHGSRIVGLLGT